MHTYADYIYQSLLRSIMVEGAEKTTRNHACFSNPFIPVVRFDSAPIVTLRKTAWKKALREMEWFLSGKSKCPEELMDWWKGQLDAEDHYVGGYGFQLKYFGGYAGESLSGYDQISFIQKELKNHPNSRRLLTTTWNPDDMARITEINENPNTPTTCHGTLTQYFVIEGSLHIKTYQRSADMLLGVPHNWIQYWAYLLWLSHHAGLQVGSLSWIFGDAHIYKEESHIQATEEILGIEIFNGESWDIKYYLKDYTLQYIPTSEEFLASDFSFTEKLPEAKVKIRPKLL